MIYDYENTGARCAVYDVDRNEKILRVVAINTAEGWLEVTGPTLEFKDGEIVLHRIRFARIYAISGHEQLPVLFHCYGRKLTNAEMVDPLVALLTGGD